MANIPAQFVEHIEQGRCTLFLGAGASAAARALSGNGLGQLLAKRFLEDPLWELGLERAASMICALQGRRSDIEFEIERALKALKPSAAHKKIPWFRWRAIVTTNYDRLVEQAYDEEPCAVQELKLITEERDLIDREPHGTTLPLIKPHGCISRLHEISVSSEDIYEAKGRRRLLFDQIEMLHVQGPVVYVGYSLYDRHILDMIIDLTKRLGNNRTPILFVNHQPIPTRADLERKWFEKVLRGEYLADGFESFMDQLARDLKPAIAPSFVIPQMAPCEAKMFGTGTHSLEKGTDGEWVCWLNYEIGKPDGFAGVMFERRGDPLYFANFTKVVFELNVPDVPRQEDRVEALKLEGMNGSFLHLKNISRLKGKGWRKVSYDFKRPNKSLPRRLQRIVLADNGSMATLGQQYRLGIRNVRFVA